MDQAQMRRANMSLILRMLRAGGPRSRSRLAEETGLSKATTSTLIADLVTLGLVAEEEREYTGAVGRPGTAIALDGRRVFGIGLEINVLYLALTTLDLRGREVHRSLVPLEVVSAEVDVVRSEIARMVGGEVRRLESIGGHIAGVGIAAPGIVDLESGSVRTAPNLGWQGVSIAAELAAALGAKAPLIIMENDAKLAVTAEYAVQGDSGVRDLIYLSGDVGVGAGVFADGRLLRGWSGFAGEVGHLPLDAQQRQCSCGRKGCWELTVGVNEFFRLAADPGDPVHNGSLPLEQRLQTLARRADQGDPRTLAALSTIAENLVPGLSLLVDVINPEVIVLGGYFPPFRDYLLGPLTSALEERRRDVGSISRVTTSTLGFSAASRGGAQIALETVFDDPTVMQSAQPLAAVQKS